MKSSAEWWAECKADPEKFNRWLQRQYIGESTAVDRLETLLDMYPPENPKHRQLVLMVIEDEATHADWIKELLTSRGIEVVVEPAEDRYWAEALPGIDSFDTGVAVAAHAEGMRLERIETIAFDPDAPEDVAEVFRKILRDEVFHEKAFTHMASIDAMLATAGNHELGRTALGLHA